MPASHFKMVESFDWTSQFIDLQVRYQMFSLSGFFDIQVGGGRFGGNCFRFNGRSQFNLPTRGLDAPPWGPNIAFGFALLMTAVVSQLPAFEVWSGTFPDAAAFGQFSLVVNTNGLLELRRGNNGTLLATGTTQMLANQYYYIECSATIDPVAGAATAAIDGVVQFNVSGINLQGGGVGNGWSGILSFLLNGANIMSVDDMYVKDTLGMLGERRVLLLKPASDSAPLQWTTSAGVTHFNLVNEVPPDGDTTYVEDSTPGDIDTYGMDPLPYNPALIDTIQVSMWARKTDAGARSIADMVSGTTGITVVLTSTFSSYTEMWDQNPLTAAAWNFAGVNSMTTGVLEVL